MADFALTPTSPLDGVHLEFDGIEIAEAAGLAIVSIATPLRGEAALDAALVDAYGASVPNVGRSALSRDGSIRLLGLAADSLFALCADPGADALAAVPNQVKSAAYLTDQSDSWAILRVSGPNCRTALERICMLDLHPDAHPVGAVSRTLMEHLGVIVLREKEDGFLLFSPRSSAQSFLHAVRVSAEHVST